MNVRIKFSKYGPAKFIGHLDVVRYFQKAFRRSGLEVAYSAGFNPHPLLYFAAPLGLGETSDAEYMDAELLSDYPLPEIVSRLNAVMAEGFFIRAAAALPQWKPNEKKESIMSLTSCADYMVSVKDMDAEQNGVRKPYSEWLAGLCREMGEFLGDAEIIAQKAAKKGTRPVDLKPMIFAWGNSPEEICASDAGLSHADRYKNGLRLFFRLASGSVDNLKPGLIMETYCKKYGLPYLESALQFHRMETYCDLSLKDMNQEQERAAIDAGERRRKFVPLLRVNTLPEGCGDDDRI